MTDIALRAAGYQGEASVHTRALRVLGDRLGAAGFAPRITPDITASGRKATELFAMTEGGELELCYFASSYLAARVPDLEILDLPFRFNDRPSLAAHLDGPFGAALAERIGRATGFRLMGYWDNGFRHLTNLRQPIRQPADCKGLTIRTMDSRLHQDSFAAMGFIPRYIDVKDYPAAVRNREVQAQENPLTNTVNFGVPETHKFLTMSGHLCGVTLVLANAAWEQALPDAARETLRDAMREATTAQRRFAAEEDARCLAVIEAAGVEVIPADGFDRAAFVAATAPVAAEAARRLDPDLLRRLG